MLFSIVVPVYNVENYLRECLDSLVNQDFDDFEIILIDDGSTDSSCLICDEYAQMYPNISVVHKKNEGLLLARRTGLKLVKGDYCMHCDSDDYYAKDTLKSISQVIDRYNPDMVMFGYNVVDNNHNILEEHFNIFPDNYIFDLHNREELLKVLSTTTWLNNMVTKVTKRELVDIDYDYRKYKSIKMGEDLFQVIPLVENCKKICYMSKPFYGYRYNPIGLSKHCPIDYIFQYIAISERMNKLLNDEIVSSDLKKMYIDRTVKDICKYFLRFLKNGVSREEYINIYREVTNMPLVDMLKDNKKVWNKSNVILFKMISPRYYIINQFFSKIFLRKRL